MMTNKIAKKAEQTINAYQETINSFITEAFDYFNGRINKLIKANLKIDWTPGQFYGFSILSQVTIYPGTMLMNGWMPFMKQKIIEIVVHELMHVDQIKTKEAEKEPAVYRLSSAYIIKHQSDIEKRFNVNFKMFVKIQLRHYIAKTETMPHRYYKFTSNECIVKNTLKQLGVDQCAMNYKQIYLNDKQMDDQEFIDDLSNRIDHPVFQSVWTYDRNNRILKLYMI